MSKEKAIDFIKRAQGQLSKGFVSYRFVKMALNNINKALKELEEWKMSVLISPEAYKKLLQLDLNWLFKQPESLEKDHIEAILKNLIKRIEEGKEF